MTTFAKLSCGLAFLGSLTVILAGHSRNSAGQEIGYHKSADSAQRMKLLLKDWQPQPMLHAKSTPVAHAKFYVIDMLNHINDAVHIYDDQAPADVVKTMDQMNVRKIVILTGMWSAKLQTVLDKMAKPYPDRFVVFTQIDWSKINDANFSAEMIAQLDDAVERGARGLKVLKDWGLGVRDKNGKLVPIDDPRMDPVWEECGRLGMSVAIHSTDPEAFLRRPTLTMNVTKN